MQIPCYARCFPKPPLRHQMAQWELYKWQMIKRIKPHKLTSSWPPSQVPQEKAGGPRSDCTLLPTGMNLQSIWGLSHADAGTPDGLRILNICLCRGCLIFLETIRHSGQEGCFSQHQSHVSLGSGNLWSSLEETAPGLLASAPRRLPGWKRERGACSLGVRQPRANGAVLFAVLLSDTEGHGRGQNNGPLLSYWVLKYSKPTIESIEITTESSLFLKLVNWDLRPCRSHCF